MEYESHETPEHRAETLPKARTLLQNAYEIYKAQWGVLLSIAVIPSLLGALIALANRALEAFFLTSPSPATFTVFMIGLFVGVVIAIVGAIWAQVALLITIRDREERLGIGEAFRRARTLLASYFWISILTAILVTGAFVLFVIPGIIFTVWFSLAYYVFIVEEKRGLNALLQSREYIRGAWWRTLWRLVVVGVTIFAVTAGIGFLVGFFGSSLPAGEEALNQAVSVVLSALMTPFAAAYLFLLYSSLRDLHPERTGEEHLTHSKGVILGVSITGIVLFFILLGIAAIA